MYALCDRLDILDLKQAAVMHIKSALTPTNALHEIFSVFSSKHEEIFQAELEFVKKQWGSIIATPLPSMSIDNMTKRETRFSNFREFVQDLMSTGGQYPHIAKVLAVIMEAIATP